MTKIAEPKSKRSDEYTQQTEHLKYSLYIFPRYFLHNGLNEYKYLLQMAFFSFFDYKLAD